MIEKAERFETDEEKALDTFSVRNLDADKLLNAYGKYGRYQLRTYFLLSIVMVLHSSQMLIMSFIAFAPAMKCVIPDELKKHYRVKDECSLLNIYNETVSCGSIANSSFVYDEVTSHTTLNSEFNLVCDNEYVSQHGSALFMLGGLMITPILTQLSDLYGRRLCFLVPLWLAVFSSIACSFAPTHGFFLIFRLLAGIGTAGYTTIGWVLCCESVTVDVRTALSVVGAFTWVLGMIAVGVLRIWISNWRWLYFVISAPGLLTLSFYWLLPESVHWMITHNKKNEIKRYIQSASGFNKVDIALDECKSSAEKVNSAKKRKRTFIDVIKNKKILFHMLIHCCIMMIMNIVYWGLALFSTTLSEDGFTGFFLSALIEIPAAVVTVPLLKYFGRRTITFWVFIMLAFSMAAAIVYPGPGNFQMIFPIAAKLFNTIMWVTEPLLVTEMSPTSVRNIFYGIVQFFGGMGSVCAPYVGMLKEVNERAPQIVVTALSIIAACGILTSPETKDRPMPEDLDDFDMGCLKYLSPRQVKKTVRRSHSTGECEELEKDDGIL